MSSIIAEGGAATADYTADFYSKFNDRSYRAAGILLGEIHAIHPFGSMVDFGCGSGTWLKAAAGIVRGGGGEPELLGVDGEHIERIAYRDRGVEYRLQDLEEPVRLPRRFDLAISLEVAEHLSPTRGPGFVEDLCAASDVVVFGASIPGQGGLEGGVHHVNERWQDYWVAEFARCGYACIDVFREKYWGDARFNRCPYYVANAFLYVREGHELASRCRDRIVTQAWQLRVVHPRVFQWSHAANAGFLPTVRSLPSKLGRAIRFRLSHRLQGPWR